MKILINNRLREGEKVSEMSENDKFAMQIPFNAQNTMNQLLNNFTFLKIAKKCRKLKDMEEMLRLAQHDKRLPRSARNDGNTREGLKRLPHSEARSKSVKPDPQGHAQISSKIYPFKLPNFTTFVA